MRKFRLKFGVAFYMFTSLCVLGTLLAVVNLVTIRALNDFRTGLNQLSHQDLPRVHVGTQLSQISATLASFGPLILATPNSAGHSSILLQANEQISWLNSILLRLEDPEIRNDDIDLIHKLSADLSQNLQIIVQLLNRKDAWVAERNALLFRLKKLTLEAQEQLLELNTVNHNVSEKVIALLTEHTTLVRVLINDPISYRAGSYQKRFEDLHIEMAEITDAVCTSTPCPITEIITATSGDKGLMNAWLMAHEIDRKISGKLNRNGIISSKIVASSSRLTQKLQNNITIQSDRLERSAQEKILYLYILLFGSLAGFVLIFIYTDRKIIRRLSLLRRNMLDLASKRADLVPIDGNDEISEMAVAFRQYFETAKKSNLDLREANKETRIARKIAEQADRAKSRFLAAASHDLRQPLHAIGLLVEAVMQNGDAKNTPQKKTLQNIQSSVTNMESLFEAILDYSQLETGHLIYEEAAFPLQDVLNRIKHDFSHLAQNKSLDLSIVPSSLWVNTDQNILERCIRNLVFNAINYTESGKILVGVRRRGHTVTIEVIDTGIGIPKNVQEKLFQEYYREDASSQDGYGLGLAIVKELVQLLGSKITITSAPEKGARFAFDLPMADQPVVQAVDRNSRDVRISSNILSGEHIILVEDNAQIREATRGILQAWGCNVYLASSEQDVIDQLTTLPTHPLAILSDFQFNRDTNGIELLDAVIGPHMLSSAGIIISGNTDPEIAVEAKARGYHFLTKPIKPSKIAALLRHIKRQKLAGTTGG